MFRKIAKRKTLFGKVPAGFDEKVGLSFEHVLERERRKFDAGEHFLESRRGDKSDYDESRRVIESTEHEELRSYIN